MKTNTLIATALAAVLTISCGDRKTKDDPNEDVEIGMESQSTTPEDMYQTSGSEDDTMSNEDMQEVADAKEVINDFYANPGSRDAYDMMTANSNRGTFADFGKMNSKYESMKVTFTDDAIVQGGNVTLPVRVVGLTKNGNSETYNGKAVLKKGSGDNAKYQITELDLDQEAN
ncbi:MAG: hypothetical protein CL868_01280 [Cytophagaceae bacterium]|nr:hypothetical protein [Cytophagaceae bacterium]|tara:strand:- start:673 stop:1188 length:516 start_codon:yes stop_codon:yes gene_type:complete